MSTLSGNCRGLGNPQAVQFLMDIVVQKKPRLIFLCETLCNKDTVERCKRMIGFEGSIAVEVEGRSGVLELLWKNLGDVNIISLSKNHIDVVISIEGSEDWRLTGFYGEPNRRLRRNTWNLLRLLNLRSNLPWCIIGDMNNITSQEDKRGERRYPEWLIKGFCEVISECNLIDLDFVGNSFTWEKSGGTSSWVEIRLDRALVTQRWLDCHSGATLSNFEISTSDHSPIYLDIDKNKENPRYRRFRFENTWLREPMCRDIVLDCWESISELGYSQKIKSCQAKLGVWGKEVTGNFSNRIRECKYRLKQLKNLRDITYVRLYTDEQNKLNEVLTQKEIFWRQRSKQLWLQYGDQNNKFFHASASERKKSNQIHRLQNDSGNWIDWSNGLDKVITDYFTHIFSASSNQWDEILMHIQPSITAELNEELLRPVNGDEVKHALSNESRQGSRA